MANVIERCAGCGDPLTSEGGRRCVCLVPSPPAGTGASPACPEHGTLPPPGGSGCRFCGTDQGPARVPPPSSDRGGCGCSAGADCGPWRERYGPVDHSEWGYPYEQQNRAVALVSCAMDTGGHEDPLIDRAACLMFGDADVDDPWVAYVIAADGMTPCPEHSDPECTAGCVPLDNPRGVWAPPA